jgi:hypothetical protein
MPQYDFSIHKNENIIRDDLTKMPNDFVYNLEIKDLNKLAYAPNPDVTLPNAVLTATGAKNIISPDDFFKCISDKTHDMLSYITWDNILMAGGSLAHIITDSKEKINDIDLFIYDIDNATVNERIDRVIQQIKKRAESKNYETRIYQNNHVVNIYIFSTKKILEIQIILRLYKKFEEILIGFDVDSCCVGYNGKNIVTTPRGLFSFQNRVNIADITRRSPSYESRLIKYASRGFDVITNFDYKVLYNKLFFMSSHNNGFVRLLEQELINNGKSKDIVFSNTLRFRKLKSGSFDKSSYQKKCIDSKDIKSIESSITKHNATIEDENLKFSEYNKEKLEIMTENVTTQFTGSFNPITNSEWLDIDSEMDILGRGYDLLKIKYNNISTISEFENAPVADISNFDAKSLAVMYAENEKDIVRIIDNKYIPTTKNLYKISNLALAILLGRTNLAVKLSKGHSLDNYKELIYLMDNDKLYAHYCKATQKSYRDIDQALAERFSCSNISANIHKQDEIESALDKYYKQTIPQRLVDLKKGIIPYNSLDLTKLEYDELQLVYGRLANYGINKFLDSVKKSINIDKQQLLLQLYDVEEKSIFDFYLRRAVDNEDKKDNATSNRILKLLSINKPDNNLDHKYSELQMPNIYSNDVCLMYCMKNIQTISFEEIKLLIGDYGLLFDTLVDYCIFKCNIEWLKKVLTAKDLYVCLKYKYNIGADGPIRDFFDNIVKNRDLEKEKINKLVKNTKAHIDALNDGILGENYVRAENVFGMTPDDNIIAKLLLIYNKVFNKKEALSERDVQNLQNLRKSVLNINRSAMPLKIKEQYFYTPRLDNLFFGKNDLEILDDVTNDTTVLSESDNDYEVLDSSAFTNSAQKNDDDDDNDNDDENIDAKNDKHVEADSDAISDNEDDNKKTTVTAIETPEYSYKKSKKPAKKSKYIVESDSEDDESSVESEMDVEDDL